MKGLLLSLRVKDLNRWTFGKVTSKTVHFLLLLTVCWPGAQSARDNHALACNFAKYSPILIFFSQALSNKSFLIWLLTTPPNSTCVATLPCILSLLACFAYINLPVMNFFNRLRFDRIMVTSLWPRFWPTLYSWLQRRGHSRTRRTWNLPSLHNATQCDSTPSTAVLRSLHCQENLLPIINQSIIV